MRRTISFLREPRLLLELWLNCLRGGTVSLLGSRIHIADRASRSVEGKLSKFAELTGLSEHLQEASVLSAVGLVLEQRRPLTHSRHHNGVYLVFEADVLVLEPTKLLVFLKKLHLLGTGYLLLVCLGHSGCSCLGALRGDLSLCFLNLLFAENNLALYELEP